MRQLVFSDECRLKVTEDQFKVLEYFADQHKDENLNTTYILNKCRFTVYDYVEEVTPDLTKEQIESITGDGSVNDYISNGDIRIVNLPVQVLFSWSDKIVEEEDEDGNPIEFRSGFVMRVTPGQEFVHRSQPTSLLYKSFRK